MLLPSGTTQKSYQRVPLLCKHINSLATLNTMYKLHRKNNCVDISYFVIVSNLYMSLEKTVSWYHCDTVNYTHYCYVTIII